MAVFDDVRAGYTLLDGQSMLIDSARERDAGIYVCIAQNNAGTTLRQIRLQVQGVQTQLRFETFSAVVWHLLVWLKLSTWPACR